MNKLYIIVFFCCCSFSHAQRINLNPGVSTDTSNAEIKEVAALWINYLKSDKSEDNPYWNEEEKRQYKSFDLLNSAGFLSPSLHGLYYDNTILSITPKGSYYEIKSSFHFLSENEELITLCIAVVVAQKENGVFKLYNVLPFRTAGWHQKRVGKINYHYPHGHYFNERKAQEANQFLATLVDHFDLKINSIDYYLAGNCDALFNIQGFDYSMGMGSSNNICGFFDVHNAIVYSGGHDEFYAHELIHLINPLFPKAHPWFLTGVAGYWGGHFGHSYYYHLDRVANYLAHHKDLNLNEALSFYKMDAYTSPIYVVGGLFCHLALERGGMKKLKKLFSYGSEDKDFYTAVEKEFGVPKDRLNTFIRKEIKRLKKGKQEIIGLSKIK